MEHASAKNIDYETLVAARKVCTRCACLVNPSFVQGGSLDSDEIGPYARWQGNLDAQVVVVAQDFADVRSFQRLQGWPGENVQTNLTLVSLLAEAGISVSPPTIGRSDDRLFLTNAVLCLKTGTMSSPVPAKYFANCGRAFLRPTIEIVRPRVVVALGSKAMRAIATAYGLHTSASFASLVSRSPSVELPDGSAVFAMYHPSRTVQNIVRSLHKQREDWRRLGKWLSAA